MASWGRDDPPMYGRGDNGKQVLITLDGPMYEEIGRSLVAAIMATRVAGHANIAETQIGYVHHPERLSVGTRFVHDVFTQDVHALVEFWFPGDAERDVCSALIETALGDGSVV